MMKDFESTAAALYDGGWRSKDRDLLISEYDMDTDEVDAICAILAQYAE